VIALARNGADDPSHRHHPRAAHRLVPQSHGFEGFLPCKKGVGSDDLPVAHLDVIGELLIKLNVARATFHLNAPQPEDRITDVANPRLFEATQSAAMAPKTSTRPR
jgi:hypothetical protein